MKQSSSAWTVCGGALVWANHHPVLSPEPEIVRHQNPDSDESVRDRMRHHSIAHATFPDVRDSIEQTCEDAGEPLASVHGAEQYRRSDHACEGPVRRGQALEIG